MKFRPLDILKDFGSFFPMVWAILRGRWKMPWGTLVWALLCAVYFLSPIDALPDVLPLLGIADDGAFVLLVLTMLHKDLEAFRQARQPAKTVLEAEVVPTEKSDKK